MKHAHTFEKHIGIPVFGGRALAWVLRTVARRIPDEVTEMWRCTSCGEQGYAIP